MQSNQRGASSALKKLMTIATHSPVKRRAVQVFLVACFFLSGACGLIYEVVWLRVLGLVFGNTTYATSAVIAGYMAGLGLGALYFGKRVDSNPRPIRLYAFLEGGIALYSFLTPFLWILIEIVFVGFARTFHPSFAVASFFKLILSFLALFIPTFLMGGTLPVLCKFFVRNGQEMSKKIGLLYALNTLGAVVGVLVSGFFLLYTIGVWQTVILTGTLNLLIFLFCYFYLSKNEAVEEVKPSVSSQVGQMRESEGGQNKSFRLTLLILFAITGGVSMMYEISWTRVLALGLGSSVYAFAVMLATFLLGIALGSYLFSVLHRFIKVSLTTFAILQVCTAFFALIGLNFFDDMPYYFVKVFEWSGGSIGLIEAGKFALCSAVMLPPTVFFGAMFACFMHIYHRSNLVGGEVGEAYFANTLGTIFGSVLTGFVIIPLIGLQSTLIMAAWINTAIGLAAILISAPKVQQIPIRRLVLASIMIGFVSVGQAFAQPWNKSLLTSGAMVTPHRSKGASKAEFIRSLGERNNLFYKEGIGSTVSVNQSRDYIAMAVNGKIEASNADDVFTQSFLGHLPLLLHTSAKRVAVIGIGSAATVAAVAAHPVEKIDAIEIEEAVVEASHFFRNINRNVLDDPRVTVHIDDGRNYLLVHPERYDVIISQPSNPWMAGVANLFSVEHYQLMRARLNPGGVVCQWLQAYNVSKEDLKLVVSTFSSVFPNVTLWMSYSPDLMLIGSEEPIVIDYQHIVQAWQNPLIRGDFEPHGVPEPEGFFSSYWLGDEEIRKLAEGMYKNSDNYPYLEFQAPRSLYKQTLVENIQFVDSYRSNKLPTVINIDPPMESNQKIYNALAIGYAQKSLYGVAQRVLARSKEINNQDPGFFYAAAILNDALGQHDEAWQLYEVALAAGMDTADLHFRLGLIAQRKSLNQRAAFEFNKAVELDSGSPKYLFRLADAASTLGQYDVALRLYGTLLQMDWRGQARADYDVMIRMADIYGNQGQNDQQVSLLKTMIQRYPESTIPYEKLGDALEKQGLLGEALEMFLLATKAFPENPAPYMDVARIYDFLGDTENSKKALRTLIKLDPSVADNSEIQKMLTS